MPIASKDIASRLMIFYKHKMQRHQESHQGWKQTKSKKCQNSISKNWAVKMKRLRVQHAFVKRTRSETDRLTGSSLMHSRAFLHTMSCWEAERGARLLLQLCNWRDASEQCQNTSVHKSKQSVRGCSRFQLQFLLSGRSYFGPVVSGCEQMA